MAILGSLYTRYLHAQKKREEELQRAKQEVEAQAKTLQILNGISRELSTLLGTDALLKRIGQFLFHLVEYSTFSILLLGSDGQNLKHRFWIIFWYTKETFQLRP